MELDAADPLVHPVGVYDQEGPVIRVCILIAMFMLTSCVQSQEDIVEIEVQQSVEVEFFDTDAGVAEEAIIIFDDLPSNQAYQDNVTSLTCAGLDLHASHLAITALETDAPLVYVDITMEVANVGVDNWRTLASFVGTPQEGATIPFSDPRFALDDKGVQTLVDILSSEVPVYRIRTTGKTSDNTSVLSVELSLQSKLSNDAAVCPQGIVAPKGDSAVTLSHGVTVDFDSMEADVAEEASISLGDLRAEPTFASIHGDLSCAAIDRSRSTLRVIALDGTDENFKLSVQVRQQNSDIWTNLATYQGGLEEEMVTDFTGLSFALPTEGANTLATLAASETPIFELRFEATSSTGITDLEVDITVGLRFGTDATGCSDVD